MLKYQMQCKDMLKRLTITISNLKTNLTKFYFWFIRKSKLFAARVVLRSALSATAE